MSDKPKTCWGLLQRRSCLVPTWRGWLVLLVAGGVLIMAVIRGVHPFLALHDPAPGGVLVVEGWAADYVMEEAMAEFRRNHYGKLLVTGTPLEQGAPLSEYKTSAELGAATLAKLGMDTNALQAVPAPRVRRDRTFVSAVALRKWLEQHGGTRTNVNVMSVGAHSRRTRLLFQQALGKTARVGVIAARDRAYDPKRWWTYSQGFRAVTDELIAYLYARFLFSEPEE